MKLQKEDREKYETFWKSFGTQIKYGVVAEYGQHKELLQDLLLFWSSKEGKDTTLAEYRERMPEDQPYYYYACGESAEKIAKLPQVERILDKGYEILYCTEDVDDFVMRGLGEIDGKAFKSVNDEDALPQSDEEKKTAEEKAEAGKPVLEAVKEALGEEVKEVRASSILKSGAVCLTADGRSPWRWRSICGRWMGTAPPGPSGCWSSTQIPLPLPRSKRRWRQGTRIRSPNTPSCSTDRLSCWQICRWRTRRSTRSWSAP